MRENLLAAAVALLLAGPAAAQIGNPAGVTPGTPESAPGTPAPHTTNTEDRLFARLAAAGGMAEVDFGRLAGNKAQHARVKEFAQRMVEDHGKANDQLKELARQANIPLPAELDPEHKSKRAELDGLSGGAFDRAYMEAQLVDHQKTATLLQWEIGQGQDADLQRFAAATLPIVISHLEMARDILAELHSAGARARAEPADRGRPANTGSRR